MDIGNDFLGGYLNLLPTPVDVFQKMQISRGVNGGNLYLIHISELTRLGMISYAVF